MCVWMITCRLGARAWVCKSWHVQISSIATPGNWRRRSDNFYEDSGFLSRKNCVDLPKLSNNILMMLVDYRKTPFRLSRTETHDPNLLQPPLDIEDTRPVSTTMSTCWICLSPVKAKMTMCPIRSFSSSKLNTAFQT